MWEITPASTKKVNIRVGTHFWILYKIAPHHHCSDDIGSNLSIVLASVRDALDLQIEHDGCVCGLRLVRRQHA